MRLITPVVACHSEALIGSYRNGICSKTYFRVWKWGQTSTGVLGGESLGTTIQGNHVVSILQEKEGQKISSYVEHS